MKGKDKRERRKYVIEKRVERRMEEKSKKELLEIIKDVFISGSKFSCLEGEKALKEYLERKDN